MIFTTWCDSQLREDAIWSRQTMKRTLPISSCDWSKCLRGGHEQQGTLCAALTTTCWDKFGAWYMKLGRHTCQTCSAHASVNITDTHTLTLLSVCYVKSVTCTWNHLYITKRPSAFCSAPIHPYYSHHMLLSNFSPVHKI